MQTLIVKYKTVGGTGSYPVVQWAKGSKYTPKDPESTAREWCARSQWEYVSHRVCDDGRTRAEEERDYRAMCRGERLRCA